MCNPGQAGSRLFGAVISVSVFAVGVWFAGCVSSPVAQDTAGDGNVAYEAAAAASLAEAHLAGAEALCRQAIELGNAQAAADTNALNQAIAESFRWACQLVPNNTNILEAALFHLVERAQYDDAYGIAQDYLSRHPNDHTLHSVAARCADAAGKPGIAAKHCEILYAAHPHDRALEEALIRLYFLSGQSEPALEMLRTAYGRHPDTTSKALPVKFAVFFASQKKDFGLALQCANIALDVWNIPAERSSIRTLAGECYVALGQLPAATDAFTKAYEEDNTNMVAIQRLGALYAEHPVLVDHIDTALEDVKLAVVARLLLKASIQQASDKNAAFDTLREAHRLSMREGYFPGESFYLWNAMLLDAEQRSDETLAILTEAVTVHPYSPEIKNCLAYLWTERGEHLDEANRLINEALLAAPQNAAYLDTKGWILFKLGRPFDALQYLLKASEHQPNDPVILDHTGDVLSAAGYQEEAVKFWQKSNRLSPNPLVERKLAK